MICIGDQHSGNTMSCTSCVALWIDSYRDALKTGSLSLDGYRRRLSSTLNAQETNLLECERAYLAGGMVLGTRGNDARRVLAEYRRAVGLLRRAARAAIAAVKKEDEETVLPLGYMQRRGAS